MKWNQDINCKSRHTLIYFIATSAAHKKLGHASHLLHMIIARVNNFVFFIAMFSLEIDASLLETMTNNSLVQASIASKSIIIRLINVVDHFLWLIKFGEESFCMADLTKLDQSKRNVFIPNNASWRLSSKPIVSFISLHSSSWFYLTLSFGEFLKGP